MYCKRCGSELEARAKFCPHCGNPVFAVSSDQKPMWIIAILNAFVVLSAFMRVHYLNAVETTRFSSLGLYKTVNDFFSNIDDYLGFMGIHLNFGLVDIGSELLENEDIKTLASIIMGIIIFDLLMYLIGIAEMVFEFWYLISNKSNLYQDGRFWKASISSTLAIFIGNSIVFGTIWLVNKFIEVLINEYFTIEVDLMGSTQIFYMLQGTSIVVYIIARVQYRKWKKALKTITLQQGVSQNE